MICALVLAAGRSRRMGAQKLLLPLGGRPVIARVVDEVLRSGVDEVFVVAGGDAAGLAEALGDRRVRFVVNPDPDGEMLSSVRCGLAAMPRECAAALVVLGDQPSLEAGVIAPLLEAFRASGRGIVAAAHGGRRGHPILIDMRYRDEILSRHDGVGLRGLARAHPEDVFEAEVPAPGVLDDMDGPEDFRRAAARFPDGGKGSAPGGAPESNQGMTL